METKPHSPARIGADNDPGIAAAPLGTDDEAGGARAVSPLRSTQAANANEPPNAAGSRAPRGVPVTVALICVLVVASAFALFTILGGAA